MRLASLLPWLSLASVNSRQTLFGCEGETLLLSCPHSSIRVVRANYGRFSVSICNSLAVTDISTTCDSSHTSSSLLRSRCDGLETCSVLVSQHNFPQSSICPSTPPYLEVQFECQENRTAGPPAEEDTEGKYSLVNMGANISKVWSDTGSVLSPDVVEEAVRHGILNTNIPITEEYSHSNTEPQPESEGEDLVESDKTSLNSPRLPTMVEDDILEELEELPEKVTIRDDVAVSESVLTFREILIISLSSALIVIIILIITAVTVLQLQRRRKGLEPPDLIPMSGTSSSLESSLESQYEVSLTPETDHIATFNNKFRSTDFSLRQTKHYKLLFLTQIKCKRDPFRTLSDCNNKDLH